MGQHLGQNLGVWGGTLPCETTEQNSEKCTNPNLNLYDDILSSQSDRMFYLTFLALRKTLKYLDKV